MNFLRQILDIITTPGPPAAHGAALRLLDSSRRLSGLSLPARVAILTAILLVLVVAFAIVSFIYFTPTRANVWARITPGFCIATAILVLVIPPVLYKALQLWLEGDVSPYPDIDRAWKAGLDELDGLQIDLQQVPLFLVLGASSLRQEKALLDAAKLDLGIREVPAGSAPIHWYAGPNGVYLVCSALGCQSRIAALGGEAMSADRSPAAPRQQGGGSIRGTVVVGQGITGTSMAPSPRQSSPAPSSGRAAIQGTMIIGSQSSMDDDGGSAAPVDDKRVIKLEQTEVLNEERRLAYLARLIRRARQPLCPINGILNLVPFNMIQRSSPDAAAVERATRSDLNTLQKVLMVRCPVTALVTGIEEESGFRELVRRVGKDRAANQRFGKGFSVNNVPLGERLEALGIHACGAFEDWIYNLFREPDSLSKPGNTKLYSLLCKVRHKVQERLVKILVGGYASDPNDSLDEDALRFGGCYFAGTGDSDERQAFALAVVGKLQEQEEELQWTETALRQDDRYHLASQFVLVLDLLLLAALAAEIYYVWAGNKA